MLLSLDYDSSSIGDPHGMTVNEAFHHDESIRIRTYEPRDHQTVTHLYTAGLLLGHIPESDTGADIEMVQDAYLQSKRSHFWVAEADDQIVGMIGVADDDYDVAEIRRLRVDPDSQHTPVALRLLEMAVSFCRHHNFLKVRLDTRVEEDCHTVELFERFSFQPSRAREVNGKQLLEFYLDLYREPTQEAS